MGWSVGKAFQSSTLVSGLQNLPRLEFCHVDDSIMNAWLKQNLWIKEWKTTNILEDCGLLSYDTM
jgi:hypothetical protein